MNIVGIWQRLIRAERALLVLAAAWAALLILSVVMGLELESWKPQKVMTLAFWLAPFGLLVLALNIRRSRLRVLVIVGTSMLVAVAVLPLGCAGLQVASMRAAQFDPSFEQRLRQPTPHGDLVLYRTNCGAMCPYGLVLRQERRVLPGLRLARRLASWNPADSATLTVFSPDSVRVELAPYGSRRLQASVEDVGLRTWLIVP